jgi:hypothetical protein
LTVFWGGGGAGGGAAECAITTTSARPAQHDASSPLARCRADVLALRSLTAARGCACTCVRAACTHAHVCLASGPSSAVCVSPLLLLRGLGVCWRLCLVAGCNMRCAADSACVCACGTRLVSAAAQTPESCSLWWLSYPAGGGAGARPPQQMARHQRCQPVVVSCSCQGVPTPQYVVPKTASNRFALNRVTHFGGEAELLHVRARCTAFTQRPQPSHHHTARPTPCHGRLRHAFNSH